MSLQRCSATLPAARNVFLQRCSLADITVVSDNCYARNIAVQRATVLTNLADAKNMRQLLCSIVDFWLAMHAAEDFRKPVLYPLSHRGNWNAQFYRPVSTLGY